MSPESSTESYPAFAHIGLRKTPGKPQSGNLPRRGIEPGSPGFAARRAGRYSTGVVDRDLDIKEKRHEQNQSNGNEIFRTAGYTLLDRKRNEEILEQLEVESVEEKISRYKFNWLGHVRRMENSRIPKIMMHCKPRGHRRPGRPLRRLLDGAETDKNSIKHTTMRVLLLQIIAPGIPLPPQPVLTRWGTWLDAVNYYAEHYGKIMEEIDALDSTDSSAVAAVKSLPSEQLLEDILFIDSNFKIVSKSIILLESSKLQLSEALNIVEKVSQTVIQNNNSLISENVKWRPPPTKVMSVEAKGLALSGALRLTYTRRRSGFWSLKCPLLDALPSTECWQYEHPEEVDVLFLFMIQD
ncbi:hypothetical protein ANN_20459 [Periplaneta americana]|uniref:Uncharacterized protein n=1 Tax=Periplaneta americana TaxID=6978 RepID=A0ABQ8SCZ4_PERAM|nr:hypothetical protein ANN_20459 [Periplaneta americana]